MGAVHSLFSLRWTRSPQFAPLPPHITRKFVSTPSGDLEVLIALSRYQSQSGPSKATSRPPILFVHGGFGHAAVWEPWMTYLSERYEGNLYAISLRGHGASWAPSFIRMCMLTGLTELAEDVVAVLNDVEYREGGRACVLVGHSSGGGLVQYVLGKGMYTAAGMALIAAVPHFGMTGIYWNWWKLDPWFMLRSLVHFQHPRSPLSSTFLVRRAFFGHCFEQQGVATFERWMPEYESLRWPIGMMGRSWVNAGNVVRSLREWREGAGEGSRVMIMAGEEDKLVDVQLTKDMARDYRQEVRTLVKGEALDILAGPPGDAVQAIEGIEEESAAGVSMVVVRGAGHHIQNDVQAEQAAEALRRFVGGL